jgi:hypothetical protein
MAADPNDYVAVDYSLVPRSLRANLQPSREKQGQGGGSSAKVTWVKHSGTCVSATPKA